MATFEAGEESVPPAKIKVAGVGGCGQNAVDTMIEANLENVEFLAVNTDIQALGISKALTRLQIGAKLTKGLGTGGNPELGKNSALEDKQRIREALEGADMIFVTAGMGGGTGTGAAPVIAQIARETGALTVGVVTKPFITEGTWRMSQAEDGVRELKAAVDTVITIPNQRLLAICDRKTTLTEAYRMIDSVLLQAVKGITDVVALCGRQNRDFSDLRTIMSYTGMALMGSGVAGGENRAVEATQEAISNPLLEDVTIKGAKGVLLNITAGSDLTLFEANEVWTLIHEEVDPGAKIISGRVVDETMDGKIRVTVIATGFGRGAPEPRQQAAPSVQQQHRPPAVPLGPFRNGVRMITRTGQAGGQGPSRGRVEEVAPETMREPPQPTPTRRAGQPFGTQRLRQSEASERSGPRENAGAGKEGMFRTIVRGRLPWSSSSDRSFEDRRLDASKGDTDDGPEPFSNEDLDGLNFPVGEDIPAFMRRHGGGNGNGHGDEGDDE